MEGRLIKAIVAAWKIGFPVFWITEGEITERNDSFDFLKVKTKDGILSNVKWTQPVKPQVGSKCLLVSKDNQPNRFNAIAFKALDEIKTTIAEKYDIEINKDKALLKSGNNKFEFTENSMISKFGDVSYEMKESELLIKVKDCEVKITEHGIETNKKIESEEDIIGDSQGLRVSNNNHGHSMAFGPDINIIPNKAA